MSTSVLEALPLLNLISKDTHLVFSISRQALRCQQAFSKPCLLNLISKDTHLVFSISRQAPQCQQAFSKPCLVNLISKDTHLVFSISRKAPQCQQAFSKPCLVNLISKDTHLVISIYRQASRCQQAFSKPCLLNLISKDTHLVFSIYIFRYRKNNKRHRTTYMLLTVSFTYIFTLLPSFIVQIIIDVSIRTRGMDARHIFEALYPYTDVLSVVSLINYAVNFFIYILAGHSFRFELRKIFVKERNTSFTATRTREEFIRL